MAALGTRTGDTFALDIDGPHRYDPRMSEARAVEQPQPSSDAERERLIAAIEAGLADLDAGRSHTHAEVLAEMRELFPPQPK